MLEMLASTQSLHLLSLYRMKTIYTVSVRVEMTCCSGYLRVRLSHVPATHAHLAESLLCPACGGGYSMCGISETICIRVL